MQIMLLNNKMVNSLLYCRRCLFLYAETEYQKYDAADEAGRYGSSDDAVGK